MTTPDTSPPAGHERLSGAERKLLDAVITSTPADLQVGDAELDNPAQAAVWGPDRTVRAELLAELLTGERTPQKGRLRAVKLRGARITGPLDMEARTLICPLLLQDCCIEQAVTFSEATAPVIRLPDCHLPAFTARQLRTTGNLELAGVCTEGGEVDLTGAHIGGVLDLTGARLTNENGRALAADGLTVDQDMICEGFTSRGEVSLFGAHIGGQLDLTGASLENGNGPALAADGLTVDQDMICRKTMPGGKGFAARGEVRLLGAHIGGVLDLNGASLENKNNKESRPALAADWLIVGQGMFCEKDFTARGEVRLTGARVGGPLNFDGASLVNPEGEALCLEAASVTILFLLPEEAPDGIVNLTNAKVGSFDDDPDSWPATMRLRGFAYDMLVNDRVSVPERLGWLARDSGPYMPQIYEQLATAYRNAGREEAAKRVAIAKQVRRRNGLNPLNWLWYVTVGYGYRTGLAGAWLAVFLAAGTWVFSRAHMTATGTHPPAFNPFAYTVDVILPIVNLGQKTAWQPHGSALYWSWALTGAGWVLTAAVVAGLTGILKRD